MKRELLGVVFCGGKSRRMGMDKALLKIRPGVKQLDYQLGLLEPFCSRLAASVGSASNEERILPTGVAPIFDLAEVEGPMSGLIAALREAAGLPVLAVACDMPFLEPAHLVQLLNRRDARALATSFLASDGMPDPMCSVYEPASLPVLEGLAAEGKLSLRRFLLENRTERIEVGESLFLASVNDRDQLESARRSLSSSEF